MSKYFGKPEPPANTGRMKPRLKLVLFLAVLLCSCGSPNTGTTPPSLEILTTIVPVATVGTNYSTQLQASGGVPPYTWSVTAGALPAGFNLSSSGVLSGDATAVGSFSFTVQVVDSSTAAASANFKNGGIE